MGREEELALRPAAASEPVVEAIREHETNTEDWAFRRIAVRMNTLYDRLNGRFFAGVLPKAVIAVGPDLIVRYAHYRIGRDDIGARHRIHLNSRHFGRPESDVGVTLLHEMVHVCQHLFGEPAKRARYHNREFVDLAAAVGIESELGSGRTQNVASSLRDLLERMGFSRHRSLVPGLDAVPVQRPVRNVKWECDCHQKLWAPAGAPPRVRCMRCGGEFARAVTRHRLVQQDTPDRKIYKEPSVPQYPKEALAG